MGFVCFCCYSDSNFCFCKFVVVVCFLKILCTVFSVIADDNIIIVFVWFPLTGSGKMLFIFAMAMCLLLLFFLYIHFSSSSLFSSLFLNLNTVVIIFFIFISEIQGSAFIVKIYAWIVENESLIIVFLPVSWEEEFIWTHLVLCGFGA